jgi:hypothetical protein
MACAVSVFTGIGPAYATPTPVFDLRLNPPASSVSSLNADSRLLATLVTPDMRPLKVISIDKRGRTAVVDALDEKELTVPAARLWIAGAAPKIAMTNITSALPGQNTGASRKLPVRSARVFLSENGNFYAVAYQTDGSYYELRYKDAHGKLLSITAARDAYGLKAVYISDDGSRVLVVDESNGDRGSGEVGQRLSFYDGDGLLLKDYDLGDKIDGWLDTSGIFIARDGSYVAAVRGQGAGQKVVLFDDRGGMVWEKTFFESHKLTEDMGGLFRLKGGNASFINMLDTEGALTSIERSAYGFDIWVSRGREAVYIIMFKDFDLKKTNIAQEVQAAFSGSRTVAIDLTELLPPGNTRPLAAISPDGKAFILYSIDPGGGKPKTYADFYEAPETRKWSDNFFGQDVTPAFVDGSRGYILRFGSPATHLIYYEDR